MGIDITELPRARREVEAGRKLILTREDIPWLDSPTYQVKLSQMRHDNVAFFFGEVVSASQKLSGFAQRLGERAGRLADDMLFSRLPTFIEDPQKSNAKSVVKLSSGRNIWSMGKKSGIRSYFIHFGNTNGLATIIKVAACDKSTQSKVYSVFRR